VSPGGAVPDTSLGAPPAGGRRSRGALWPHARRFYEPVVAMVLSTVIFVLGFGGGIGRLSTPLGGGDILAAYNVGRLWGSGAPFGDASTGYPFGTDLRYFPTADTLQNALAGLFTAITGNTFLGTNAIYALSFPLTALAALWVLRIVGLRGPMAVFLALAYTAIPFHWLRTEHLYLATIYPAVLGVGLALLVGSGEVERRLCSPRRLRTVLPLVGIVAVTATSGIYYACFTMLLCTVAVVYRITRGSTWRGIAASLTPVVGVAVLTGLALAPAFLHERAHPSFGDVAGRLPIESVVYSGNVAMALMPYPESRLPGFEPVNDAVRHFYTAAFAAPTSGVTLWSNAGSFFTDAALLFAGIGLVLSLRRAARARSVGSVGARETTGDERAVGFGLVGVLLATALLFFVPWGLNAVFAFVVTPQLRGWDRLVPVLLLLFLVAAAVAWRALCLPTNVRWVWGLSGVFLVLLTLDSVIPYRAYFTQVYAVARARVAAGDQYAMALNAAVPGDCGVLTLPYVAYPESAPVVEMGVYEPYWPALTNPEKDWSFAAMKNTVASAWQEHLGNRIDAGAIADLQAGGFCAVHVDRRGYLPADGDRVVAELTALLGTPVAVGDEGRWLAFAMPDHSPEEAISLDTIADAPDELQTFYLPPTIERTGAAPPAPETDAFGEWWWLADERASFAIRAIDERADFNAVSADIRAADCQARQVVVSLSSGDQDASTVVDLAAGETKAVSLRLARPATDAVLSVTARGAVCTIPDDARALSVAVLNPVAEYAE